MSLISGLGGLGALCGFSRHVFFYNTAASAGNKFDRGSFGVCALAEVNASRSALEMPNSLRDK